MQPESKCATDFSRYFFSCLAPQGEVWEGKKLIWLFCQILGVYWVACVGAAWPCALGTNMFHVWKQLVNLGAKPIELNSSIPNLRVESISISSKVREGL